MLSDSKETLEYKNIQEFSSDEEDEKNVSIDDDKNEMELVFGNKNRLLQCFKEEEDSETETETKIKRKPVWQDSGKLYTNSPWSLLKLNFFFFRFR